MSRKLVGAIGHTESLESHNVSELWRELAKRVGHASERLSKSGIRLVSLESRVKLAQV